MNDLVVKNVDLMGDNVLAAKDSDGVIWVGVSYICKGLGMNKGHKDRQVTNVQKDETLKRGCCKFEAGVFDVANETVALRLDFIPMWLAKISITDKMQKEHPELAEKLLNYQLKAKDILAEAFMPKQNTMPTTTDGKIMLLAQGHVELKQEVDNIKEDLEQLKQDLPILPLEADKINEAVKGKGVDIMGGKLSNAYNSRSIRQKVYNNLYFNLKYNFGVKSYKAIKRSECDNAIEIINAYKAPFFLQQMIDNENAQQRFDI